MKGILQVITTVAVGGATIITAFSFISFLAPVWWVGELLVQPRPQYALGLALCLPFVFQRSRQAGWVTLIVLVLNLSTFAPLYLHNKISQRPTSPTISVLHYNLDNTIPNHDPAFEYLRAHPVDILSLQELTPEVADRLQTELPGYEIVFSNPLANSHGSAVLIASDSGLETQSAQIIHLPEYSVRPLIEVIFKVDGYTLAFLNFHAIRPVSAWNTGFQEIEFTSAAEWSVRQQEQGRQVFITGDFNSTPWSANFQQMQADGHLLNSGQGFGLQPTWLASLPAPLTIPIDHALHSSAIVISERFIGPFLGSDHAALHVQFFVPNSSK